MSKLYYKFVLAFTPLSILCCSGIETYQLDSSIFEDTQTIEFSPREYLNTSEFADSIGYLVLNLPDSMFFGELGSVAFADELVFISDKINEAIFVFDKKGNYQFLVKNKGMGPGEYAELSSFHISPTKNVLSVFSRLSQKVILYDLNGDFIGEYSLGHYLEGIYLIDDKSALTFSTSNDEVNGKVRPKGISHFMIDQISNSNLFSFGGDKSIYAKFQNKYFTDFDKEILFLTASDTLFSYESESEVFRAKYIFNFGRKTMPSDLKGLVNSPYNSEIINQTEYFISKDYYVENDHLFGFTITDAQFAYWAFYLKNNNTGYYIEFLNDDLNGLPITIPISQLNSITLVSYLPQELLETSLKNIQGFKEQFVKVQGVDSYNSNVSRISELIGQNKIVLALTFLKH